MYTYYRQHPRQALVAQQDMAWHRIVADEVIATTVPLKANTVPPLRANTEPLLRASTTPLNNKYALGSGEWTKTY